MTNATMTKPLSNFPPKSIDGRFTIFMAGSIEMGKAEKWQERLFNMTEDLPIDYLNPRRDDWDSSWTQTVENKQFSAQVEWELAGLSRLATIFYFDPNTSSPITLLELGLAWKPSTIAVCCPKEYFRRGNVEIVCNSYDVPVVETLEDLANEIRTWVNDE